MTQDDQTGQFLLCVKNDAYPASLEVRKVYQALADPVVATRGFVRMIDTSSLLEASSRVLAPLEDPTGLNQGLPRSTLVENRNILEDFS
jgi:hypothetical protein